MKTVAKKAKRIGLLFSVARAAMQVDPKKVEDIPDIEVGDFIFTDGCGLIAPGLASQLSRRIKISFRNMRYTPSVFQIRYRGYKGVVTLDPTMPKGGPWLKMRKSMKKFSGGDDLSFSVVEYSKVKSFHLITYQHTNGSCNCSRMCLDISTTRWLFFSTRWASVDRLSFANRKNISNFSPTHIKTHVLLLGFFVI
ncbi:RNA dependent RNA polymerase domain-containing protein [Trichoderma pleuroticola]